MNLMGYKRVVVSQHERALVLKHGTLTQILGPGVYRWLDLTGSVEVLLRDLTRAEMVHPQAQVYRQAAPAIWNEQVLTVETGVDEAALVSLDGRPTALIPPAERRFYWKGPVQVDVERIRLDEDPGVDPALLARMMPLLQEQPTSSKARSLGIVRAAVATAIEDTYVEEIPDRHLGLLFVDGRLLRTLEPGLHGFWNFRRNLRVEVFDLRVQELAVQGQEIMTADKVSLRLNLSALYRVTDPVRLHATLPKHKDYLHRTLQFALRQAVAARSLDALLAEKGALETQMRTAVRERIEAHGMILEDLGLKDVILPGDMKEILNQVVQAEKAAQANLIRRREETAATRSLLNTAKLMDQNPVLLRLKELEALERVTERVGSLTVFGGLEHVMQDLVRLDGTDRQARRA